MKPGVERACTGVLPQAAAVSNRVAATAVGGEAGDHLDQRHQRRRVEEVQAGQALGRCSAEPMAVTEIDEVLVPKMQSAPTMSSRSR
jgi:hypothetical protein